MLVLSRGERQSVVIGDAITMTVERLGKIDDGLKAAGTVVQLGFDAPRYVSIHRNELLSERQPALVGSGTGRRKQPRPGRVVAIPGVVLHARIQVPRKVPVSHNGKTIVGSDLEEVEGGGLKTEYHIACHEDDRITICNNISIAVLHFHRFVYTDASPRMSPQDLAKSNWR